MLKHAFAASAFVALSLAALTAPAAAAGLTSGPSINGGVATDLSARCTCAIRHRHVTHEVRYRRYAHVETDTVWYPRPQPDPYAPRKDPGYYYWPGGPVPPPWRHYY